MKQPINLILLGIALGISITSLTNYIINHTGGTTNYQISSDNTPIIQQIKSSLGTDRYSKFDTIYTILKQQHYNGSGEKVDQQAMIEGALHGFVEGIGDPYTSYFDIQESSGLNQVLAGDQTFEGIGAVVTRKADGIQIMEVLKSSPAQKAGLKPLDLVIKINDQEVDGMSVTDAVKIIRGPKGSTVSVTIFRPSEQKVITIPVIRDKIEVPSVTRNVLTNTGSNKKIGYISLSVFGEDTYLKFHDALQGLQAENIQGYIIDLRGNGGGFLPTAVDIASFFVPKGNTITTTRYTLFPEEKYTSDGRQGANRNLPIVVLVDGYSASASEVLALALKQNVNAVLIGDTTFGKGSIQTIYEFKDGSSLKYTIGRRYAPDNTNVDHQGIMPDQTISFDKTGYESKGIDNQLLQSVNYFK